MVDLKNVKLGYTTSDDGVHATCELCEISKCLGFCASVEDAAEFALSHVCSKLGLTLVAETKEKRRVLQEKVRLAYEGMRHKPH